MSNQPVKPISRSRSRASVNAAARESVKSASRARVKDTARASIQSRAKASVKAKTATRKSRAPDTNKIKAKLQALLEKYERAYELVQQKMAECEKNLKQLDEYMKRELKAKEEYDTYAERYKAILDGAGTRF
jgi:predicted nuclease with TOPRIM domain